MIPSIALIAAAIAMLALVVSMFGAPWPNQRPAGKLVAQLEKRFDHGVGSIEQRLDRIERQLEVVCKPVLPPKASIKSRNS
ncbi:MAG: hypothetical protein HY231_05220 [Acidobacteria bacterium]|nr:hypothetical protein [Acidobacteriota bacterium]